MGENWHITHLALKVRNSTRSQLNNVSGKIKRNRWNHCPRAESGPIKEVRHRLTIDYDLIGNGDLIVPPQTLKMDIIKSEHDDIHCGIAANSEEVEK